MASFIVTNCRKIILFKEQQLSNTHRLWLAPIIHIIIYSLLSLTIVLSSKHLNIPFINQIIITIIIGDDTTYIIYNASLFCRITTIFRILTKWIIFQVIIPNNLNLINSYSNYITYISVLLYYLHICYYRLITNLWKHVISLITHTIN